MRNRIRVSPKTREQLADDEINALIDRYMAQVGGSYQQNEARVGRVILATFRVSGYVIRFILRADGLIDLVIGD